MIHVRQLVKGIAALTAAVALVVGVPAVLVGYVGWPLPTRLPTFDQIGLALRSGIDPQLLINTLAVVVWVAWAQLVIALTVESAALARGKAANRVPVLPGMQAVAARLVATITLVAASLGPLRAPAAAAVPLSALIIEPTHHTQIFEPELTPSGQQAETTTTERGGHKKRSYQLQRFDTLWRIAETTLGDGQRWQEIRDLNLGHPTSDGQIITNNTERIAPGTTLQLPADATLPDQVQYGSDSEDHITAEVTVEPGDHFWAIAEKALEDAWGRQPTTEETAAYWRQVIEINQDQLLPPHDPDLIYPGQVFQLPQIPNDLSTVEPTQPTRPVTESGADEVTVEQGDHLWRIAEGALTETWGRPPTTEETARYWQEIIHSNQDRLLPPSDPDLIYPGQAFRLPVVPQDPTVAVPEGSADLAARADSPPTVEEPVEGTTTPDISPDPRAGETPAPHDQGSPHSAPPVIPPAEHPPVPEFRQDASMEAESDPGTEPVQPDDQDDSGTDFPVAGRIAGLGLLAAGIIALIDRLRRSQLRQRKPGTVPTPPPVTATRTEATLRAAAAPTAIELVDLALRALAHQITDNHTPPPQVVGVHLSSDILRLLLWSPHHDPPPGWQVDDDGHSWTFPASIDPTHLHLLADATPAPYPALVTVGHDDDTQLLLDLEHLGAVQITGEDVTAACYTMATELAASPIADILEVVCVGFGHDLEHLERITVVDRLTDALASVEQKNTATSAQGITPFEGRLAPWGGDTWAPLIILDPSSERPEGADGLLAAAHRGRAVCAAVGYPTGGRWRLHLTDGTVHIDPLGYTYKRRNITPAEQGDIADLTRTAKDLDGIPQALDGEPASPLQPADHTMTHTQDTGEGDVDSKPSSTADKPAPEIRTLGTLHVEGLTERFAQPKCLELVTYLAYHRHGVEADTLMEALYPEQPPNSHRLDNLMWRARRALGADPKGEPYLPPVTGNRYLISPQVGCDTERLTRHIRSADQAAEADVAEHLQAAIELVEGPPFGGIKDGYGWAHTEGIITHAIVTIDNAAHRLAKHALQAGKLEQATWAARKGLTVSWACEECYRNLMRAAIAQDNKTALDAIYNELTAIVDADQGPDTTSWLDPDTIELYERHSRNPRRHTG